HKSFGHPHRINRIHRFVRTQADNALNATSHCSLQHIVRSEYVGLDCFHRIKLARRNLLECRCMEHVVDTNHTLVDAIEISYVPYVEAHAVIPKAAPHVILFLLVSAKDTNLADIALQESG